MALVEVIDDLPASIDPPAAATAIPRAYAPRDWSLWEHELDQWIRATAKDGDYFDEFAAEHAVAFFPRYLRHTKGRWAGQVFELLAWQRIVVRAVFGWKRADGTRRFRTLYIEIGRKNGKTGFAAGLALYLAFASGEMGAEVYCAATDKAQAGICFREAAKMRAMSPGRFKEKIDAFKWALTRPDMFSKLEVISSDFGNKDGLNISGLVVDEFHAWRDAELYDVLHTAEGARTEPLEVITTTAGAVPEGPCWEMHEKARLVLERVLEDHEFLPIIFAARPPAEGVDELTWLQDPRTWAEANPSLGDTINFEYLEAEARKAVQQPRLRNVFKRYHLGIWTQQTTVWLPMEHWRVCTAIRGGDPEHGPGLERWEGRSAIGALDLSATTDLTALALTFPPLDGAARWGLWTHFWMPEEAVEERTRRDRVPYDRWVKQGWITATPGNVVDYNYIRRRISGGGEPGLAELPGVAPIRDQVELLALVFDRHMALPLISQFDQADGIKCLGFGQGYVSMSPAAKEFEKTVIAHQLDHGDNPVLNWMARIVEVKQDEAENIKPVKPDRRKNFKRIDGIVAALMGFGTAIAEPMPSSSFWEAE